MKGNIVVPCKLHSIQMRRGGTFRTPSQPHSDPTIPCPRVKMKKGVSEQACWPLLEQTWQANKWSHCDLTLYVTVLVVKSIHKGIQFFVVLIFPAEL